jgi:hypothetical protein
MAVLFRNWWRVIVLAGVWMPASAPGPAAEPLRVGFAEADITPPNGFPMAGYYHERLAEGAIDPL